MTLARLSHQAGKIASYLRRKGRCKANGRTWLLSQMPPQSICAEIGVWKGEFSEHITEIVKPRLLHLVDPWTYQPEFPDRMFGGTVATSQKDMDRMFEAVCERFRAHENVHVHREYSEAYVQHVADEYFDWIYIDGNHSYEFVKRDLEMYVAKVRTGGFITGDDFNWRPDLGCPVRRAVEEVVHSGRVQFVGLQGGQFVLRRC